MDSKVVYLVEVGVLMKDKSEESYDFYANAYDKKYGYYDEEQMYVVNKDEAIEYVRQYVEDGVDNTYGVVSTTELDAACFDEDGELLEDVTVEDESYAPENIVLSIVKEGTTLKENFICTDKIA